MTEQTTEHPAGWTAPFKRFATWFVQTRIGKWATEKTARWQTIIAILVLASGYPLVIDSIGSTNEHLRLSDQRAFESEIYQTNLTTFAQATTAYAFCLHVVEVQISDRGRWERFIGFVASLDDGSGRAADFADSMRQTLLSNDPPSTSSCVVPGPAPTPPGG